MKDQEFIAEKIRSQYTQQENTDLDALKALDPLAITLPVLAEMFGILKG